MPGRALANGMKSDARWLEARDETITNLKARVAELEELLWKAYNHIDTRCDDARQVAGDISKSLLTKVPPTD